jgi:hypothetical protein
MSLPHSHPSPLMSASSGAPGSVIKRRVQSPAGGQPPMGGPFACDGGFAAAGAAAISVTPMASETMILRIMPASSS